MKQNVLIKSTSGVRGIVGRGLDPILATRYAAAFGTMLGGGRVVVGRDSRPSGLMFSQAVISGLMSVGCQVVEIGIVPTPTVEIAVKGLRAGGGICLTASHNPSPWNALKFFNRRGEFVTATEFRRLSALFESGQFALKPFDKLGSAVQEFDWIDEHVRLTLKAKGVSVAAVRRRRFKVVVDAVNGAGSVALPMLLERMGARVVRINCDGTGEFFHEPEPVAKNLGQLGRAVRKHKADIGLACDPDADRLALVDEHGYPIGEELTLALAIQPVLAAVKGPTVINLSTSRVTADVAQVLGSRVYYSKVGESNVVTEMRRRKAVIGGEGNGGVIYPGFHAGRDCLIGAALVLTLLARRRLSLSALVETLPKYYTIKTKAALKPDFALSLANFERDAEKLVGRAKTDHLDGVRVDFDRGWLQIRRSNTEPIFRLIVETDSPALSRELAHQVQRYFK